MSTIPVFAKAGAIVPLDAKRAHSRETVPDPITFAVFPGASGSFDLYEDEQDTLEYKKEGSCRVLVVWPCVAYLVHACLSVSNALLAPTSPS
jgi:alpha-glucosidase (family GH31 glycosyl hydrolase)